MDIKKDIKSALTTHMSKVGHINQSKDLSKLSTMISEKTVKFGKKDVYEILDEVMTVEGDIDELRLNPFGSNIKDIEKASASFIKVMSKKLPKLKVQDLQRLKVLFGQVESELRNVKNQINLDGVDEPESSTKEKIINKVKGMMSEITGAASAGGFLGPLFSPIVKQKGPSKPNKNKKSYEVKEDKGFSKYLETDENPNGETDGLTPDVLNNIISKIVKSHNDEEETPKMDTKEATMASSSGSYETPFFLAKNSKNWRGAAKTLYKGGKFVKVKDKCKTFPYCNQGDIKALELFENGKYSTLAEKVADKMGEDPLKVKSLVLNNIEESLFQTRMKEKNEKNIENSEKNNKIKDK